MLLIVTGTDDATADLVATGLKDAHVDFMRLNTDQYPQSVQLSVSCGTGGSSGMLSVDGREMEFSEISVVWYRKPNPPSISGDVQQPEARTFALEESRAFLRGTYRLLEHAFWVSRPESIRRANDKLYQLQIAASLGFTVPRTLVTNSPERAAAFCDETPGEKIVKPLTGGSVEYPDGNVELIYTSVLTPQDMDNLHQVSYAPCLLQDYVQKQYELRITVIGRRAFVVGVDSQHEESTKHDWRRNLCQDAKYFTTTVPKDLLDKCFLFMDHYGLKFSAFDFVKTPDGAYVFLENNPNGQWAWLDLDLNNGMIQYMVEFLRDGGTR
ncbi:MAG: hypothetical protein ISS31_02235 [Kiritimatiellae bacterium]|nr:hypothetical protein [Kiritimatiellia bacterium]